MSFINPLVCTPMDDIVTSVKKCRERFRTGQTRPLEKRKEVLRAVIRMLDEHEEDFCRAVHTDLRKSALEFKLTEIMPVRMEGYFLLDHMAEYAAPEKPDMEGLMKLENSTIRREPLGVVLIIGAWNYPLHLTLIPVLGALAAGNTVVLKPSDMAPSVANTLQALLPNYIPSDIFCVINGGVPETTLLLAERFDHILYTGSSRVGSVVMTAAARHLTPVTLELGGKSPAIIDASCKKTIKTVAKRIMWGKVLNAGQICVAPDYVLVHYSVKDALVEALREARCELMGDDPLSRNDYMSIVNAVHYKRLLLLMNDAGNKLFGGESDDARRIIAPAVFDNVPADHPMMTDEIFGPLLPIVSFSAVQEVVEYVNNREKPLALYVFADNDNFISTVLDNTSSGGVCVNDIIMHMVSPFMPFGGVGQSGMGKYRGKYSFETFSHTRSVLRRRLGMEFANEMRYMPYTPKKVERFRSLLVPSGERSAFKRFLWNYCSPLVFLGSLAVNMDESLTHDSKRASITTLDEDSH